MNIYNSARKQRELTFNDKKFNFVVLMDYIMNNQDINKPQRDKELLPNRNVVRKHLFCGALLWSIYAHT